MIGPRKVNKPLVLYGYRSLGRLAEEVMGKLKIPIKLIVDQTNHIFVKNKYKYLLAVCVASESYWSIYNSLTAAGWTDICSVYDIFNAYPEYGVGNGWVAWPMTDEDDDNTYGIMGKWSDEYSQRHYAAFMDWRISHMEFDLPKDMPIVPREPLPSTFADIEQRRKVILFWTGTVPNNISIHTEGRELKTIEVNMHLFQKYRPTIDVACYHSRDGLWKIEKALMDGLPDYRWTFRLHAYQGQAAYIYGTPKERE